MTEVDATRSITDHVFEGHATQITQLGQAVGLFKKGMVFLVPPLQSRCGCAENKCKNTNYLDRLSSCRFAMAREMQLFTGN